ncbi:peptidylprolyl isomerase [Sphaerospermopsis aphanizomenoides BCCUSP55]|uniref:peptidylprolyl isomerase n=1 Tax=Sphaerospermopsis aphanizomenoides TaxID=459663 RepID=UPI000B0ACB1A|nr:peptidylprolyl isomerase [Sphaerospermopsis aphanizomenoides]MBK1986058.1 peptidylprolyl isomerase [Sphaerospermopsis aphanizomenoides BCCUSP55]
MNPVLQFGDASSEQSYRILTAPEILELMGKYQLIPPLLKEVVIDQAIAQIECTPQEEQQACEQLAQQYQGRPDQSISPEQLNSMAIRQLKLEKFKEATWGQDLESYFFQRKSQLDRVIYSLITTSDIGIAQEIYFRIQEGEQSFAELAREYAQGPEAQTDGLVGPVELQSLHPRLIQILSVSQPQQLSPPNQIGEWIVIVRLEKLLPAQLDRPMRQRLLNERFQAWLQTQTSAQNWQIKLLDE